MIESTSTFLRGLQAAFDQKSREGTLSARDRKVIRQVLDNPVMLDPRDGKQKQVQKIAHSGTRTEYLRLNNFRHPLEHIQWDVDSIVAWIKAHWMDILRVLLTLLPFLI